MQVNAENLAALEKGYRGIYMAEFQGSGPTLIERLSMITTSTKDSEVYAWLGALPGMKEVIGQTPVENFTGHAFTIRNKEFDVIIGVPRQDIERDTYGLYNPRFQAMGEDARSHPDRLLAEVMVAGFDTKCYTGKNFFDANHAPEAKGVTFSNKGTKKLSAANYEAARAALKSVRNAKGRSVGNGKQLTLVVSPDNESTGRSIVVAETVAGGGTNVNYGTATLEVWPELSAHPDMWFLFEMGKSIKPFIWQKERPTEFNAAIDLNTAELMKTKQFLFQSYGRYNVGYGLPELAWGSTGADPA